jgi:hypothetical protein
MFSHVKTVVFCLSVCWRRNKWKLSDCKRTKRTCPSVDIYISTVYLYIYISIFICIFIFIQLYLYIYMLPFHMENGSPADFP